MHLSYDRPQFVHVLFASDSDNGFYDAGDDLTQPFHKDNSYEDLQDTSGLETPPETGLLSPPYIATEEGAFFAIVFLRSLTCSSPHNELKLS